MKDFYLTLSSKSSVFKANTPSEFTIVLRPEIQLTGNWSVGLVEIVLPKETTLKPKYLLANFIASSVVGETRRPVLRTFYKIEKHIQFNLEHIPVTDRLLDTLVFELVDEEGTHLALQGETYIRLHFVQW